jgi:hypothetical protein
MIDAHVKRPESVDIDRSRSVALASNAISVRNSPEHRVPLVGRVRVCRRNASVISNANYIVALGRSTADESTSRPVRQWRPQSVPLTSQSQQLMSNLRAERIESFFDEQTAAGVDDQSAARDVLIVKTTAQFQFPPCPLSGRRSPETV